MFPLPYSCPGFILRHCGKSRNKEKSLLLPEKSKIVLRALERWARASWTQVEREGVICCLQRADLPRGGLGSEKAQPQVKFEDKQ